MKYITQEILTNEQKEEINGFIMDNSMGSIYQMPIWSDIDKSIGIKYIYVLQYEGDKLIGVAALRLRKLLLMKIYLGSCVRGPVCTNEDSFVKIVKKLDEICRKYKIVSIVIHPYIQDFQARQWESLCQSMGYKNVQQKGDLHSSSMVVNLEQDLDEIFKSLRQTTRYEIKKADKFNLQCYIASKEKDIKELYNIYSMTSDRKSFSAMSYNMLYNMWMEFTIKRKLGVVLLTKYEGKTISGVLIMVHGDRAVYTIGGSAGVTVKGIPQNHFTQWNAIKWAKGIGCRKYDLGGIDPNTNDIGMKNINTFKRGFSKVEVSLFHRHEKVFFPIIHKLIYMYLGINR